MNGTDDDVPGVNPETLALGATALPLGTTPPGAVPLPAGKGALLAATGEAPPLLGTPLTAACAVWYGCRGTGTSVAVTITGSGALVATSGETMTPGAAVPAAGLLPWTVAVF